MSGIDRTQLVRLLRVVLPLAALVMLSVLFLLGRSPDPEARIPYVTGRAEELARDPGMTSPEYAGVTPGGANVTLQADRAAPQGDGTGTAQRLRLDWTEPQGLGLRVDAGAADVADGRITLGDGVRMSTTTGWTMATDSLAADTRASTLTAPGAVTADGPLGRIEAGGLSLVRDAAGAPVLDLNGGVRLVYRP